MITTIGQGCKVSGARSPGKLNPSQWHLIFVGVRMNISVAARSKAWVCAGSSLAGIAGTNSAMGMDVCPLRVSCGVR